jgi:hypothetical protein
LIQVCWELNDEKTRKREISSLARAGVELKCKEMFVITKDYEATETVTANRTAMMIQFTPLWRWLLTYTPPSA